ncbi:helix-turn-helix transcriptional regulator [Snodgrassella sp. B3088]|uniref:S24 family peptidase n=1 Tax=Snodgrassella TaxID=1193515 RepID=UPI0022698B29|nr:helix-turn-helix transcriptional regulator [Snodgrassella sp. B3088]MCX8748237.1 helix-turn-helix transcriptional regulator [Snodgrassella sp. B3088]
MENTTARLYQAAKELKGLTNPSQIARAFNTSPQTVKNWESRGMSKEGLLKAQQIIGVSALWLETGEGNMQLVSDATKLNLESFNNENKDESTNEDFITIDQFDIEVSCGPGINNANYPDFIRSINIPKNEFLEWFGRSKAMPGIQLVTIKGDSMEPTLPNRAIAFVDSNINEFQGDGIYAFVLDGEAYIKRLQRVPGKIIAISDNTVYEPFYITPEMEERMRIAAKFIRVLPFNMREL